MYVISFVRFAFVKMRFRQRQKMEENTGKNGDFYSGFRFVRHEPGLILLLQLHRKIKAKPITRRKLFCAVVFLHKRRNLYL